MIDKKKTHLLKLLAVEEVAEKLLDARNTSGTTNKHDLINLALLDTRILENLLHWLQSTRERLGIQVLETSTSNGRVEIFSIKQRINLNSGLGGVRQSALGTLTGRSQSAQGSGITRKVLSGLTLELLLEMLKQVGIEILSTKVSITSGSLHSEHTALDVQQGHIEGTTTEIIDEDIALLVGLSGTKTVGDGSSSGFVDDTKDVKTRDSSGILSRLTLVVVEVGWHSDNRLFNLLTKLGFRNLFHL